MADDVIREALDRAVFQFCDDPRSDVHTVYRGLKEVDGELTEQECVVCCVGRKASISEIVAQGKTFVPAAIVVHGQSVPTDVVETPAPVIARLDLKDIPAFSAFAGNVYQGCHQCPIPGGVQIAPKGANWVGTLGGAIAFPDSAGRMIFGGLTNYHVAHGGQFPVGTQMLQPGPGHQWFGKLHAWAPIAFGGRKQNRIDVSLLNCRRTDGPYAPATDTVQPFQHGIGDLAAQPQLSPKLGMPLIKVGRTTGLTRGKLVGVDATTTVDYGPEGVARFVGQFIIRSSSGMFSAGGDSGSLILEESTRRPVALLFAGGGRDTIANPIGDVLNWSRGHFFERRKDVQSSGRGPGRRTERHRGFAG